jgi:hypothetical protein
LQINAQDIHEKIVSQNNSNSTPIKPTFFALPKECTPKSTAAGGSRPENKCPQINQSITPLIADNGKDYTSFSYPTFWFYIPYPTETIKYLEFALINPQTNTTVFRRAIQPQNSPGIIKITIPQEEKFALKEENNYDWKLMLTCQENPTYQPDDIRSGWIQKLASDSQSLEKHLQQISPIEAYQLYVDNEIWYDAINQILELYLNNPDNNPQINQQWLNLLAVLEPQWLNVIESTPEKILNSEQKEEQKQNLLNVLKILRNTKRSQKLFIESELLPPDL